MQIFYTVRQGDTLSSIAERWHIPLPSLIAANNIPPPYTIYIRQQLSIPPGVNVYRVKDGDTIFNIAQTFKVPSSLIIQVNQLLPPYTIYPEQLLRIPAGVPFYIVQQGDTLFSIGRTFNVVTGGRVNTELIRETNQLSNDFIQPGQKLMIPYAPPGINGFLAYTTNITGNYDIWLYNPLNGEKNQVTFGLGESYSIPFWSPNGLNIAFVGKNKILYVLNLITKQVMQIDQMAQSSNVFISWSSDSKKMVYSNRNNIIVYHISSHQNQIIHTPTASDVQWFPNEDKLLYQALDSNGTSQLYTIRPNGTERRQITQNVERRFNNVRLSPNGEYVVYTTPGVSISIIHIIELKTGKRFEIKGGPLAKNYHPTWSPKSDAIAFSATAFDLLGYFSQIRISGVKGENEQLRAISNCYSTPVSWSADGLKMAYLSGCYNEEQATEIWMFHCFHPVPIRLVADGASITGLQWSPVSLSPIVVETYTNTLYKVMFQYPSHWQKITNERYEGLDGFFQISAISSNETINEVCQSEAFHPLQPYGSSPTILPIRIQNENSCLIWPSDDQQQEMRQQAAIIAPYPNPIQWNGVEYPYFVLWASKHHIRQIGSTIKFLT